MIRRALVPFAGLMLGLVLAACGDDDAGPIVSREIRVETARFFPAEVHIAPGSRVRWVNVLRREASSLRTVTSGEGPGDAGAGLMFDVELEGFAPGEGEGEDFIFRFEERGTYPYFSRLPVGQEFSGTVVVE